MPSFKRQFSGFDRRVWILFYGRCVTATGFSMAIPFLSLYLHNDLGISMSLVGLVLLVSSLVGSMGNIVGGEVADRYGRKRIMSLALAWRSMAFLSIALGIATGQNYLVIASLITLSSFGGSLFDPASNAMVADVVEPTKRLEAYGLLRIGQNIGWALGPMVGGLVSIWLPFSYLFLIGALATAITSVFLHLYISESLKPEQERTRFRITELGHVTHDSLFMFYCAVSVLLFMNFGQMSSSYAVYSTDSLGMAESEVALLWTWNGIMVIFMQMPISRWIGKHRMTNVISAGSLMYAVGWGMVGLAGAFHLISPFTFAFLFLNMTIVTMGEMFVSPASMNLVATMSPENERGRYMGVFGLVSSLGFSLGPFSAGLILDNFAGQDILIWVLIGTFGVLAAIGYQLLGRMLGNERDRAAQKA